MSEEELEQRSIESIDLARAVGAKTVLAMALVARAQFENVRRAYHSAILSAKEALSIARYHHLRLTEIDSRIHLSNAYRALQDDINAQAEAHLARDLADELGYASGYSAANDLL
jgi:hypothetical protein